VCQTVGEVGRQARPRGGEPADCGKGTLGKGEPAGKVSGRSKIIRKPVAQPSQAFDRAEQLTIEEDRRWGGGPGGIPLHGGAPVDKLSLRDAENHVPLSCPGFDGFVRLLEALDIGAVGGGGHR